MARNDNNMWMKTAVGLAVATGVAAGAAYMADRATKGGLRRRAGKLMGDVQEYAHQVTPGKKRGRRKAQKEQSLLGKGNTRGRK